MAGCYHDTQDFTSDLDIEVAREGDILKEGQELKDIKCTKNSGHKDFIPFKDLTLENLPYEHRNIEMLDTIKKMGSCVVKLVVEKMKKGRLRKELGSGSVFKDKNMYFIKTNNHVVKTDDEVKQCTVEFHYDDDSRSSVLTSSGVELMHTCSYRDVTFFTFNPVPEFLYQLDVMNKKLSSIVIMYTNNQIATDIPYPHIITQSRFQFYCELDLNSSLIDMMFISWVDGSISYMKNSYFKFQPIPSNIQELTSIEIHIDEDDGNSEVILGDVVKLGDEFVVVISETIFQDEVKKCRLVWNGEVIGRGTRLYFKQVKSSDMYSGIDLERDIEQGRDNCWLFEFHPIPRVIEDMLKTKHSNNMCCIGHPHGCIKMITFGLLLEYSLERFDNQYRHITEPGQDCKCKEVGNIQYSCKTCPGSSGSPVCLLSARMDLNSSLIHFMGKSVNEVLPNGELIENINNAWDPKLLS